MDSTVIAAIIGAVATIVVVIIQRNSKKDSSAKALEKSNNEFLMGIWKCEWWYKDGKKETKENGNDMSQITIYKIDGNKIFGKGFDDNEIPDFSMEGIISGKTVILDGSRGGLKGGEIRLFIEDNKFIMKGDWDWRDTPDDPLYGGRTIWTKLN